MIARMWQAWTAGPAATARYRRVFETDVLPSLHDLPGFRGAYLLARPGDAVTEIRTITLFDSLDAVRGFTGDRHAVEHVTAPARAALLGSNPGVTHFEVLTNAPARPSGGC
ncbi:antibiotic biosynthesis monooxygenase [Nonomuraea sp. NPDC050783]|uniref:antibiotic biosynthesis monooxygenase family protein n=1 Tax=Nonomuraea sp. NPDC050783 TaxID=3154634 RepID=UPI00346712D2